MIEILLLIAGATAVSRQFRSAGLSPVLHVIQYVLVFLFCEVLGVVIANYLGLGILSAAIFGVGIGAVGGYLSYRYSVELVNKYRRDQQSQTSGDTALRLPLSDESEKNEENDRENPPE